MFAANYDLFTKLIYSTIVSTVSAVSCNHRLVGLADTTDNFYIKKLLIEVHKKSNTIDLQRPNDLTMLSQLVTASKTVITNIFTQLCMAALLMLADWSAARPSNIKT